MQNYLIVGNGVAATGCIEGIRSVDSESPITVISKENHPVYCRPLISYYLEGKTTLKKMSYREEDFYRKNNCNILFGMDADSIDPGCKTVHLCDGTSLSYTKLCIATGSSPFVPPMQGLETVKTKFSFMTMDDATSLEKALHRESKVLIVGAGLIGLKCAEGISGKVASITVCDLAPRILSSILDDECASIVQSLLEQHGISFLLADTVATFNGNQATMKSGKILDFDILVLAVGVRANSGLAKEAGVQCNRGILTDFCQRTSAEDIFSAGDCAEGFDYSLGSNRVLAIWPNAYLQGFCAGQNMAGKEVTFDNPIPMNSLGFFGFHMMTAGSQIPSEKGGTMMESRADGQIRKFFFCNGRMTGFMLLGDIERAGIYTSLIRNGTPMSEVDFEKIFAKASSAGFTKEYRCKEFGGMVK